MKSNQDDNLFHRKMIKIQMYIYGGRYLDFPDILWCPFWHLCIYEFVLWPFSFVDLSASDLLVSFACQVVIDPSSCGIFECWVYCPFTLIAGQAEYDMKRSYCMTVGCPPRELCRCVVKSRQNSYSIWCNKIKVSLDVWSCLTQHNLSACRSCSFCSVYVIDVCIQKPGDLFS